jgi:putative acetyltransferase
VSKVEIAVARFAEGCSCAQAVFSTYAEPFGIDRQTAMKLSAGFGGGMGMMGETCGVATGAFLILGLKHGGEDKDARENACQTVREFAGRFKARHGSLRCKDLLGCDISTPEGLQAMREQKRRSAICTGLVRDAAKILEAMLGDVDRAGAPVRPDVIIRPETPGDHASIRNLLIAAFANHPYSRQTEHLIVEGLRASGALALSLVAELDGDLVGHVAFSPMKINGLDCRWLGLGPLAVWPARQRQGIGQRLVRAGLETIRKLGAAGCVLVGDLAYYRRFGFDNHPAWRMEGVPPEVLLCLPMSYRMPEGSVTHQPAFFAVE